MNRDIVEKYTNMWVSKIVLAAGAVKLTEDAFDMAKQILINELSSVLRKAITYVEHTRDNLVTLKIVKVSLPFSFDFDELSEEVCDYHKEKSQKLENRMRQAEYYRKHSDQLMIDFRLFCHILRYYSLDFKTDLFFTKQAALVIQHYIQNFTINVVNRAMWSVEFKKSLTSKSFDVAQSLLLTPQQPLPLETKRVIGNNFYPIVRVLKQVHPNNSISLDAVTQIDHFIIRMVNIITSRAKYLFKNFGNTKGIDSRTIHTVVRQVVGGELAKHAVSEGTKAVTKYASSIDLPPWPAPKMSSFPGNSAFPSSSLFDSCSPSEKKTRANMAGLQFNVQLIHNLMIEVSGEKVTNGAAVYLSAVCEYLTAEILELSGNATRDERKSTITARHVDMAVNSDEELCELFRTNTIGIIGGGRKSCLCFNSSVDDHSGNYTDPYTEITDFTILGEFIVDQEKDSRLQNDEDYDDEDYDSDNEYVVPESVRSDEDDFSHNAGVNFALMMNEFLENEDEEEEDEDEEDEDDEEDEENDEEEKPSSEIDPKIAAYVKNAVKSQTQKLEQEINKIKQRFGIYM